LPKAAHQAPPRLRFRVAPEAALLLRARDRIRDYLLQHCAERPLIDDVVLCVEEACTNAIRHSETVDDIEISLEFAGGDLVALVKDRGRGFDIDSFDPAALPDLSSDRGRGLFLISRLSDEMELRLDGGLEVSMVRRGVALCEAPILESGLAHIDSVSQLAHREARTRALLDEIDEGFFALDWEYRVAHANRAALRLADKTLEQVRGRTPWELFPEVSDSALFDAFRDAMAVGRASVLEHRFVGTGDWLEVRIYPTGAGLSAYYREINGRKAAEEELLRYRLLSQQARDIMLFVRYPDGRILEANAAAEKAYGYSKAELLTRTIHELRAPATSPSVADQMAVARDGGILFETLHRRADGSVFPVEVSSRGMTAIDGETVLLSVVRDITERKRAEQALRESEEAARRVEDHYRNLFDTLIEGFCTIEMVFDADGRPVDYRFLEANHVFEESTGLHGAQGRLASDLALDDDERRFDIYGRVALTGEPARFTAPTAAQGRCYEVSAFRVGAPDSRQVGILFNDITERKRAEEERQRLNEINELMHSTLRVEEIMERVVASAVDAIGSDSAMVALKHGDDWVAEYGYPQVPGVIHESVRSDEAPFMIAAVTQRRPIAIDDCETDPLCHAAVQRRFGVRSVLCIPLIERDEVLGVIFFNHHRAAVAFTPQTIAFAGKLAEAISSALENARLYEEQLHIANTLQKHFIHPLPSVAGLDLGTVSRTATEPEAVGGDFNDVFLLEGGQVAILIGDVAGKGVRAAGLTETVRSTVRAFATIDASPAFVLRKTSEALLRYDPDEPHVTAFFCLLDPRSGYAVFASAGHPAPLHLGPSSCLPVAVTYGPPLGTFASDYATANITLTREDYLVLYTDGVIEARRGDELFGEERLVEVVAGLRGRSARELADGVLEAVVGYAGSLRDDLQVVTVRLG
jgi:PAS domain S-box-containing protein